MACDSRVEKADLPDAPHSDHYKGKVEPIDLIEAQELNFLEGSIIKYVCRHKKKGTPLQDLEKAEWYLKRLIERVREK